MRTPLTYYGGKQCLALPPKLLSAAQRLQGIALENGDAVAMIPRWGADALIYVDPPYTGDLRTEPTKGYAVDDDDGTLWTRLVAALAEVQHAAVILSGYPCEEADELGWRMVPLRMKRTVQSRDGGTLDDAPEVVWLSPAVPEVVPHLFDGLEAEVAA